MSHLKLVVDNTNLVPEQPFKEIIITTRDEMEGLRGDFDDWMKGRGDLGMEEIADKVDNLRNWMITHEEMMIEQMKND